MFPHLRSWHLGAVVPWPKSLSTFIPLQNHMYFFVTATPHLNLDFILAGINMAEDKYPYPYTLGMSAPFCKSSCGSTSFSFIPATALPQDHTGLPPSTRWEKSHTIISNAGRCATEERQFHVGKKAGEDNHGEEASFFSTIRTSLFKVKALGKSVGV